MPPRRPTDAEGRLVLLPSSATSSSPTLSEAIRVGLADEITSGQLPPGEEIDEQAVAERFGVSRTPVREALRDLAALGLVEIEPRRGVRVAALTADRLGEMFEVMAETEAMCARLATYRMTAVERLALQALHRRSQEAVERGDVDRYDAFNRDFHSALYRGTHNAFLADHATPCGCGWRRSAGRSSGAGSASPSPTRSTRRWCGRCSAATARRSRA